MAVGRKAKTAVQRQCRGIVGTGHHRERRAVSEAKCLLKQAFGDALSLVSGVNRQGGDADLPLFVIGADTDRTDEAIAEQRTDEMLIAGLNLIGGSLQESRLTRLKQLDFLGVR